MGVYTAEAALCMLCPIFTGLEAASTMYTHRLGVLPGTACTLDDIQELPFTGEDLLPDYLVHPVGGVVLIHHAAPDHIYLFVSAEHRRSGTASCETGLGTSCIRWETVSAYCAIITHASGCHE